MKIQFSNRRCPASAYSAIVAGCLLAPFGGSAFAGTPVSHSAQKATSLHRTTAAGSLAPHRVALPGASTGSAGNGSAADPLPIRDVVLFTSGVGYFQRSGIIDGSEEVPLSFRAAQVQDILKSMILLDPAGRVEPVTYTSEEPMEKTLHSFGIDVSQNPTMFSLLEQLRGEKIRVTTKNETIVGEVVSVETRTIHPIVTPNVPPDQVTYLNLLTDSGIESIRLDDIKRFTVLNPVLAAQLKQAMGVLASGHDTDQKSVTLKFGQAAARKVQVGYVTEAPLWKTSYRMSVGEQEKPYMQGWAIVDNTTDHDWDQVNLTLVSGEPISFIENLYTPLYVPRPTVAPEYHASPYPQLAEENVDENARRAMAQRGTNGPGNVAGGNGSIPGGMGGGYPGAGFGGGGFGGNSGYAPVAAADMAAPAPPAAYEPVNISASGVTSAARGQQAGELFQYRIAQAVSIPRRKSAMIPIVTGAVEAVKLDIFNADLDAANPHNCLDVTNTTGLHLKAGPVTVFDAGSYAGDARLPEMEPGEVRLLPYAVDAGITGVRENTGTISHISSFSIKHGVLIAHRTDRLTTPYTLKNKLDKDRTVLIEQPIKQDWKLITPEKPDEKTRSFYRFKVVVPAGKSEHLDVIEEEPVSQGFGLVDANINVLMEWHSNSAATPAVQAALADIAQKKQKIALLEDQLSSEKATIDAVNSEQDRIRKNMAQLDRNSDLYKRYVAELDQQETHLTKIKIDLDRFQTDLTAARADLTTSIDKIDLD